MSETTKHTWWATSKGNARWTAGGAAALVTILAVICGFIWLSPSDIVKGAGAAASHALSKPDRTELENKRLTAQLKSLEKQLGEAKAKSYADSDHASQAQESSEGTIAKLKGQISGLQSSLSDTQSQAGSARARLAATQQAAAAASADHAKQAAAANAPKPPSAPAPITAPSKAQILAQTQRWFGVYTEQSPFSYSDVDSLSAKIGETPTAIGYFQGWDKPFRPDALQDAWSRGELPVMTWESRPIEDANNVVDEPAYSLGNIIDGDFDAYLTQYAQQIAATGLPVVIRLDHEMNGTWYPWSEDDGHGGSINGNSQGQYVKMWQHVWTIFQDNGANNDVIWDWSPNIVNNLTAAHRTAAYTASLYPGDKYVDIVGVSGYLRPPYASDQQFTFDYTYTSTLDQLRGLTSKKILLSEIGASETGGHKTAWVQSLFQTLANGKNDDVIGFMWFSEAVTTYVAGELSTNDWRIDSTADSLAAFTTGLKDPADDFLLVPPKS